MNTLDYGGYIRIGVGEDLSEATSFSLALVPPGGSTITKSCVLGVVDANGMAANEYVNYLIEEGVFSVAGTWEARLTVDFPTHRRSTDFIKFMVSD